MVLDSSADENKREDTTTQLDICTQLLARRVPLLMRDERNSSQRLIFWRVWCEYEILQIHLASRTLVNSGSPHFRLRPDGAEEGD